MTEFSIFKLINPFTILALCYMNPMHRATKLTLLTIRMNSSLNCFQWLPRVGTYIHNSDQVIVYKDQVMRTQT